MTEDYYAVLGVPRDASDLQIRQAFRGLAQQWHPDHHPHDVRATERFMVLMRAWSVLHDADARAAYDASGLARGTVRIEAGSAAQELFGSLVDGLFGVRDKRPVEGRDRSYDLVLTVQEVARGARRELMLPAHSPCAACGGRGFPLDELPHVCVRCGGRGEVQRRRSLLSVLEACDDCVGRGFVMERACRDCGGTGAVEVRESVSVEIPAGVSAGQRLRMRGKGEPGRFGGQDGDLWLRLSIAPHALFTIVGDDLHIERPVPFLRAAIGGWVRVPSLDGAQRVRLPTGVLDGEVLRLPGLGVQHADGRRGDQLVTVVVETPQPLPPTLVADMERALERCPEGTFPRSERFESEPMPVPTPPGAKP